jgi:ATPase subunit of ABC transporter with duplicated ATPase domains
VIEIENLKKGYGDRLLIEDLTFSLPPGGIVGVIGPNGAGKSTLFRMLTGQEQPDAGTLEYGDTVKLSYVDQSRDALDPDKTVWEEISGGAEIIELGDASMNSRAYCGAFNFKGGDQQKKVGLLSGGERNRVHMAKLLKSGGNVLLLDEPTNDLDVETLRALEDALEDFAGCAVIISTTGSSSTASAPTSSPSRARRMWNGSRATSRITRKTRSGAWDRTRWSRSG